MSKYRCRNCGHVNESNWTSNPPSVFARRCDSCGRFDTMALAPDTAECGCHPCKVDRMFEAQMLRREQLLGPGFKKRGRYDMALGRGR